MTLYESLACELKAQIDRGLFEEGDKLPSVRQLSKEHHVSIATVQEAYRVLESQMYVEAKPKSGYFVSSNTTLNNTPKMTKPPQRPMDVSQWEDVLNMLLNTFNKDNGIETRCQFQHAMPNMTAKTLKPLTKRLHELTKNRPLDGMVYGDVKGDHNLRKQLSRLTAASGCRLQSDEFIVTSGCQEALSVCLRAVANAGDVIVVESPGFYGAMQAIKGANLKALEIPTDSETGLSLDALKLALDQWPVKAILVAPTVNNPQGFVMPDDKKKALYDMAREYDVAIIEDDIYGDIAYSYPRPRTVKSFDEDGRVLLCSSFSKTLAPGFRVGWIAPGSFRNKVLHAKYVSSSMCPTLPQLAIASYIEQGGYDKHIRAMRHYYLSARDALRSDIKRYFPYDTCVSYPQGGYVLWVELNAKYDAVKLADKAKEYGIYIAPGQLFSATGKYRNCLRFNFIDGTQEVRTQSIKLLGELIESLTQ
ncbi:PLP-dependent aminotransferase family protein [Alteromonas sp. MMG017]|uniref:aminotransferase-like domain-containing protein n=1 Tax=Alteromonas sp. MMG017 TaxID=2822692 RepID=UPI001B3A3B29|nr:PLP-dependent aminotransferase family protein [Alteromonas sp. MMG017]MBQ4831316.1 PLP-dependent aminotransferase family protein [Alteromonas sp. MMG017]